MNGGEVPNMQVIEKSSLLQLPGEIRQQIYEYALAPTGNICLCPYINCKAIHGRTIKASASRDDIRSHIPYHQQLSPNLLATCRPVYHEARDVIFDNNIFMLTLTTDEGDNQEAGGLVGLSKRQVVLNIPSQIIKLVKQTMIVVEVEDIQNLNEISHFFDRMTSLRYLSIAILTDRTTEKTLSLPWVIMQASTHRQILKAILNGVPETCKISLDPRTEAERSYIVKRKTSKASLYAQSCTGDLVQVMPGVLELYARDVLKDRHIGKEGNSASWNGQDKIDEPWTVNWTDCDIQAMAQSLCIGQ